jgi:hypothetical protein
MPLEQSALRDLKSFSKAIYIGMTRQQTNGLLFAIPIEYYF